MKKMEDGDSRRTIRPELIDELLKECADPTQLLAEGGFLKQLTGALIERCLQAEIDEHLGYPKHGKRDATTGNVRNGSSRKILKGAQGEIEIAVPRDRQASFEPLLIPKHETRLEGFDEKILALYARGMTTRDIQAQIQELYGVEISAAFVSNVTEAVLDEVHQWQNRPLEALYPIVYVDCLVVKVRENQRIINRALYLALGVNMQVQPQDIHRPDLATHIHGITADMLHAAPTLPEVWPIITAILRRYRQVLVYNAAFDHRLLDATAGRYGYRLPAVTWDCLMEQYAVYHGAWHSYYQSYTWQTLQVACACLGVQVAGEYHRATADALASLGVLRALAFRYA